MFCMLLRKHLQGAKLAEITQLPMERCAVFRFLCTDEMGDRVEKCLVAELMGKLNREGAYTVPEDLLAEIQGQFWAGCCDDAGTAQTIRKVWQEQGYLCDTHTATAWNVAEQYVAQTGDQTPMVVLSTASPYKFPASVLSALEEVTGTDEFAMMDRLFEKTGVPIPSNLQGLQTRPEKHTGVIAKDGMLSFVMDL